MAGSERRIRRPAVSCSLCRKRKIRCNRGVPCSNCVRTKGKDCIYENHPLEDVPQTPAQGHASELGLLQRFQESVAAERPSNTSDSLTPSSNLLNLPLASSTNSSVFVNQLFGQEIESMRNKIRYLEEQLYKANLPSIPTPASISETSIKTTDSNIGGTFHLHLDDRQPRAITRSVTHKSRLFGQSHWINVFVLFQDLCEKIEPLLRVDTSKTLSSMKRCKSLARVIKLHRKPPWPCPPTPDLPPKAVADALVNCYLRTNETVYRILHIPTFRKDYEAVWVPDTEPNMAFLVQLKLVLAIGAVTYDENFSLRTSAIRWVYEAQTWLSEPKFKSRLGIQSLQTNLLLLIAQETADVSGDSVWASAGALLRRAMYMGLHKDPAHLPKVPIFVAEMRRRLWNTILEISLQSSLTSGGPPLISVSDFDTGPPGNFDDDQLLTDDPLPNYESSFIQVSIAIALRKTLPVRLAVVKFLNDLDSRGTYEETLRLDAEIRASHKTLYESLQKCQPNHAASPPHFERRAVDFIMHRYLSALHVSFFSAALHETSYAFSRKVVIETSLKIWYAVFPPSSIVPPLPLSGAALTNQNDLARLVTCGRGFYRTVAMQAMVLIAVELKTQLQEEPSLGPVLLRPDLLTVLEDAKTWCLRCIEAGETNVKGYLLLCVVAAHIEGLMRGRGENDLPDLLVKAAEDSEDKCLQILENMAAQGQAEGIVDGLNESSSDTPEGMENWDFMMPDDLFQQDDEATGWMFTGEFAPGISLY